MPATMADSCFQPAMAEKRAAMVADRLFQEEALTRVERMKSE